MRFSILSSLPSVQIQQKRGGLSGINPPTVYLKQGLKKCRGGSRFRRILGLVWRLGSLLQTRKQNSMRFSLGDGLASRFLLECGDHGSQEQQSPQPARRHTLPTSAVDRNAFLRRCYLEGEGASKNTRCRIASRIPITNPLAKGSAIQPTCTTPTPPLRLPRE